MSKLGSARVIRPYRPASHQPERGSFKLEAGEAIRFSKTGAGLQVGWWMGYRANGQRGKFPRSHVRVHYSEDARWGSLVDDNLHPTQEMVDLCLQLLYALGASAENYLAPDAYAAFRQSQTYPLSHNLWLQYLNKSLDYHLEWPTQTQKVKYADDMARLLYHSFNFTSVEIQRTEDFALVHSALHSRPHPHDPPAPFLTSSGFIDAVVYDLLDEPVNALARLNLALEIYRPASYTEKDHVPIPREALPSTAIIQGNMEFQELKRRGNENLRDTLQY